ncbi:hypothetical protein DN069_22195 [Streptacidiphilus pinicola]|uniref:Uncharacterized protein n=1 Tax=Streptacidiphilus pinicola TaxID=2219663 RepID=A0A2X0IFY6_9ACTN|nr:hypothetical protein [Streptacidiphilus pinicola]RAG83427.1 hypothetical protein DN069_22195 [Streptacidiphilus pinicola]
MVNNGRGWRTLLAVTLGTVGAIGPATAAAATPPLPPKKPRLVLAAQPLVAIRSGGRSVVHEELWNLGNAPESTPVVLDVSLPPGVSVTNLPANCTPQPHGHIADCLFPAGLKPSHADRVDFPIIADHGLKPAVLTGQERAGAKGVQALGSPAKFYVVVLS